MNKTYFVALFWLMTATLFPQERITGSWEGSLRIRDSSLRLAFHIEENDTSYTSRMDSPDQGAFGLPTTRTTFRDHKLEIVASGLGLFYRGTLEKDTIHGFLNQGGISFPLSLRRAEKPGIYRPQTPVEPLPYHSEEVAIPSGDEKITLAGTLTLPDRAGRFPAVLLIAGSGPNDRDETLYGHKPFFVISDHLTRHGFATLRYDKRGVGKSTGDFRSATMQDFEEDAKAAVAYLQQRKEIDPARIGLSGHSEGGLVAAMVASGNSDIRFTVLMAAPGTPGVEVVMDQNEISMLHQGVEPETLAQLQQINRETFEMLLDWNGSEAHKTALRDQLTRFWDHLPLLIRLKANKDAFLRSQFNAMTLPGYISFLHSDPSRYLEKVTCPVLAINGEQDTQVLAGKNLSAIATALYKGGNRKVETRIYPGLNHLFQEGTTGLTDEYARSEQTLAPAVLNDLMEWMESAAGLAVTHDNNQKQTIDE